jgi:L-amino acid N-acyltransferase YncA
MDAGTALYQALFEALERLDYRHLVAELIEGNAASLDFHTKTVHSVAAPIPDAAQAP